ncbi:MAG: transposase [Aeriscardovia aeriphila]|nr:transposase [Aeriscardovia aeriphila]
MLAYIEHQYSNGITEGINNQIKKIKRDGYGFTNFHNYRLRILLALGGVHSKILNTILIP